MAEIKDTQVYTRVEAEALLKISQSTMMRLIKRGVIKAAKIGGQYRILGSELLRQFGVSRFDRPGGEVRISRKRRRVAGKSKPPLRLGAS
jgi:excisionase family DNA binding protein